MDRIVVAFPMTTKTCSKCNQVKDITEFVKMKKNKSGYGAECLACKRIRSKAYREEHPEKMKAAVKRWNDSHPERMAMNRKRWRANNPVMNNFYNHKYIAQRHGVPYYEEPHDWVIGALIEIYNSPCNACGTAENVELDHIVPYARGGSNLIDNWQPLCHSCNRSKNDKLMEEWKQSA